VGRQRAVGAGAARGRPFEPCGLTPAEGRRGRRPGLAVTRQVVGPELGAQRDQRCQVRHRLDRARLGHADEPVRVEVVAQEERRVRVDRREEARPAVVEQVALVDRLETDGVALLRERREDRLVLALPLRTQRLLPEAALTRRPDGDRLPEGAGYSQAARSFVQ
jgi:ribosomal protein L16/L10AE